MGVLSTVKSLPADILAELEALLLDPRVTQLEATRRINKKLAAMGEDRQLSKSAVNRYAMSFEEMTGELAETRRISDMLVAELGVDNNSQVGRVTTEMTRVMVFHFSTMLKKIMNGGGLDFKEMQGLAGMIKDLAISHEKLEKSATENEKRAIETRRQAREEAAQELAEGLKNDGISPELEASIRRILIGG